MIDPSSPHRRMIESAVTDPATVDLDEIYDPTTVGEIDAWPVRRRRSSVAGARGSTVAGALLLSGLTGVKEALGEKTRPAIVEVRPDSGLDSDQAVTVFFVPDLPAATVAVVRPWLLTGSTLPAAGSGFRADTGIPGAVIPHP